MNRNRLTDNSSLCTPRRSCEALQGSHRIGSAAMNQDNSGHNPLGLWEVFAYVASTVADVAQLVAEAQQRREVAAEVAAEVTKCFGEQITKRLGESWRN